MTAVNDWTRIADFCREHRQYTEAQVRTYVQRADSNGLAKAGAVKRIGRTVWVSPSRYFNWWDSH